MAAHGRAPAVLAAAALCVLTIAAPASGQDDVTDGETAGATTPCAGWGGTTVQPPVGSRIPTCMLATLTGADLAAGYPRSARPAPHRRSGDHDLQDRRSDRGPVPARGWLGPGRVGPGDGHRGHLPRAAGPGSAGRSAHAAMARPRCARAELVSSPASHCVASSVPATGTGTTSTRPAIPRPNLMTRASISSASRARRGAASPPSSPRRTPSMGPRTSSTIARIPPMDGEVRHSALQTDAGSGGPARTARCTTTPRRGTVVIVSSDGIQFLVPAKADRARAPSGP